MYREYSLNREERKGLIGKFFDLIDKLVGVFNKRRKVFDKLYRGQYKFTPSNQSEASKEKLAKPSQQSEASKAKLAKGSQQNKASEG